MNWNTPAASRRLEKRRKVCYNAAMLDAIAFDADDTLWHNEVLYTQTQAKYRRLLERYASPEAIDRALFETEMRNLRYYGYGIKSFALSMIETAVELSDGQIRSADIQAIIGYAKSMLDAPVHLLDGAAQAVAALAESHTLMLITKGDLLNQEHKIQGSGLADYFTYVEVVSHKTPETYRSILDRYGIQPGHFLMVGNSLRSDVLPVLAVGGQAVHIPYHTTWAHEMVDEADGMAQGYHELAHIGLLPELVATLEQ